MAILKQSLGILAAALLAGCTEDFTPDIESRPVLCLNSLITAGEPIEVEVSHTWLFTDDAGSTDHTVSDATVTITANGSRVGSDYIPAAADVITVEADSPTYGHAEATVTVPEASPITSVKWVPTMTRFQNLSDGDKAMNFQLIFNVNIELTLDDASDTDNYYLYDYNILTAGTPPDSYGPYYGWPTMTWGNLVYEAEPIFSEHIGIFESVSGSDPAGFTFFTDRQFAGKSYTLHLQYEGCQFYTYSKDWDDSLFDCSAELSLYTVSESLYYFVNYLWQRDEGYIGDLGDLGLSDPAWGYSNVSTGAGVVAARSRASYTIDLHDFLENAARQELQ